MDIICIKNKELMLILYNKSKNYIVYKQKIKF
jgi:hypothetical protein